MLAVVNVYVFLVRDASSVAAFGALPVASIGRGTGVLGRYAEPRTTTCPRHPVRIFEGLTESIVTSTHVGPGRTLRLALLDAGVRGEDIAALEAVMRTKVDVGGLAAMRRVVRIAADRTGGLAALEIEWGEGHLVQGCKREGAFEVRHVQQPARTDVVAIGIEIGRSADLAEAFADAGESAEIVWALGPLLAYDLDVNTELRPGDRMQVLVEKRFLGSHFHRYGTVLAVRFVGALARFAYYRHVGADGLARFRDRNGVPHLRAFARTPVPYLFVSPLARPLLEPRIEVVDEVPGFVYRLPEGAPVVAIGAGEVVGIGDHPRLGRVVVVEAEDGTTVRYGHLARNVETLEVGTFVEAGRLIGFAGHSGDAPAPRLRVELWRGRPEASEPMDPSILLARRERRPPRIEEGLSDEAKRAFLEGVRPWSRALRRAG